ncbi:PDDEXK nuclease domain-containing protein [Siphonobacter sp. SORGH_AS_0500]|uniref:PDDEXK nuclease domain-containing protein n=1 Tax=Siphonobacter sp. SORGH_AS_0500 TaxID=1864824 RepID=UPI00285A1D9F|nr:PDDEXK nuclease domain-containing protein [Siphonobacter sp. SORGH_AS_0500]MDR6197931.1 putative nuclease of restriction endonuclease-like (RecB) superfamily [Siphonobacter sp. SORGH_AS_0500]
MHLNKNILSQIQSIIANAQQKAIRSVDFERVLMYWHIGKVIVEEEQQGEDRATYGTFLIKSISDTFQPQFGTGFSVRQLEMNRQFYRTFPITNALRSQFSWTHYRLLIRIDNQDKREFYIAEAEKNNWTARQLERQINSQLFERLLLSNDVQAVLAVARNEKQPTDAKEIIKDPMVLEFLGLKREASYYEKDLETAIITHLQDFILELGNGFAFVARQKRIHIDGDEYFVDLVFYNRLLQCFIVIEIKTQKLTHQDLGQLQMYVNYYDRYEKQEFENPTIGILLCTDKNDAMVKISLPESNKTIITSKYQLYLPTEQQLLEEVKKEIEKLDNI